MQKKISLYHSFLRLIMLILSSSVAALCFRAPSRPHLHLCCFSSARSNLQRSSYLQLHNNPTLLVSKPSRPSTYLSSAIHHQSIAYNQCIMQGDEDRMEELIVEVGRDMDSFVTHVEGDDIDYLREALVMVDLIERLGIQRHFKRQIKAILDSLYSQWEDEAGLASAEVTVLAFRLLRLNGYQVSAGVLKSFKDGNGEFSFETLHGVLGMLNLYRCSQIGFPNESKIMREAEEYATAQLNSALLVGYPILQINNLIMEVKCALDHPRACHMPRLESRSALKQLWPGDESNKKCLELAKLDLGMTQKLHQQELEDMNRWLEEQGYSKLGFGRNTTLKVHFAFAAAVFEPQFSAFRIALDKIGTLAVIVDDLFDQPSLTRQSLYRFKEAVRRWDSIPLDDLPQHKVVFMSLYKTTEEIAAESSKAQGRELLTVFKALWEDLIAALIKDTEWNRSSHTPTLREYLELANVTVLGRIILCPTIFLMGEAITDEVLHHVGKDSRFMYLVNAVARLCNDIISDKREADEGKLASAVSCYIKDNPGCSRDEAIASLKAMIKIYNQELEWELAKSRAVVPECCSRMVLNFARISCETYKTEDAFSETTDEGYEQLVKNYLYESP